MYATDCSRGVKRQGSINLIIIFSLILSFNIAHADGKFLRGKEKEKYTLNGKAADFYVSAIGNDQWSGKLAEPNDKQSDGPFATIERAKWAVQALKNQIYKIKSKAIDPRFRPSPHTYGSGRDILVLIREGTYILENTLTFSFPDGGERVETDLPTGAFELHKLKDYYVTYAAYPGERPLITGGRKIQGWKKGESGKWTVHLDKPDVEELFANGQRQTLARTPNNGFFRTKEQPTDTRSFRYKTGDIKLWPEMESNRIIIISRWSSDRTVITHINEKNNIAYLKTAAEDMVNVPPKYYIENIEALLDSAGEWYFDPKKKILSYIPQENIGNPNEAEIVFPEISGLFRIVGSREKPVRNLRFYNLSFSVTKPGGEATIFLEYAKNCEILGNRIHNISQTALRLGLGCYHNLISKNLIRDVKGSGIMVTGDPWPDKFNDVVSDNVISYNEVIHCRPAAGGIGTANALRTTISHNYVSDTGSYGITAGSWSNVEEANDGNHLVEHNHVSYTNMIRDDEGGIAVYGLSPGSVVRNNLVHDVRPAGTNENVGFFFQNMSSGWTVTDNIYYNLKQGEMKLCACYLVDNHYQDNHVIETPVVEPERIITAKPDFSFTDLQVKSENGYYTGNIFFISATVFNRGSTGNDYVHLYIDGKVAQSEKIPVIANNYRNIEFRHQFSTPGEHAIAIGTIPNKTITIKGKTLPVLYSHLSAALLEVPAGDSVKVKVQIRNVQPGEHKETVNLFVDQKVMLSKDILIPENESNKVEFTLLLPIGNHAVSIGNYAPLEIRIYAYREVNLEMADFLTYCSSTAKPCEFEYDLAKNRFKITTAGTDFLHAEDSYGTIYLNDAIDRNFVATVKVAQFGDRVSEWFRTGIFVRNDLAESCELDKGSLGSFLMFTTPKRAGAQWDEFGDGSMHNTKSRNYDRDDPIPVWLKLIRHGDRFSGYYSFDGLKWILSRESGALPGLAKSMDIGLAAGTNDQRSSQVVFEDFNLKVEIK